jgi:hypothetical protein
MNVWGIRIGTIECREIYLIVPENIFIEYFKLKIYLQFDFYDTIMLNCNGLSRGHGAQAPPPPESRPYVNLVSNEIM